MWLTAQLQKETPEQPLSWGLTTIGGNAPASFHRNEQRNLAVCSPDGIAWLPCVGDTVLLLEQEEQTAILGRLQTNPPPALQEGELYLYSRQGAAIHLQQDGTISLYGNVVIRGNLTVQGAISAASSGV